MLKYTLVKNSLRLLVLISGFSFSSELFAETVDCGILEKTEGEIQILDATREHLLQLPSKSVLPCGAWISTKQGWVKVKHQYGSVVSIGSSTLVQVLDSKAQASGDHLTLYKGQIYVKTEKGAGEFKVLTSGARARVSSGRMILLIDGEDALTQLITLHQVASLENRFEPSRKVKVAAGEASQLDLRVLRVVPSAPKGVSVSSLHSKFSDLQVPDSEQDQAMQMASRRQKKVYAADILDDSVGEPMVLSEGESKPELAPESAPESAKDTRDSLFFQQHLERKLAGGSLVEGSESQSKRQSRPLEQKSRAPRVPRTYRVPRAHRVHVQVIDPSQIKIAQAKKTKSIKDPEKDEKKRLMDELSNIKSD